MLFSLWWSLWPFKEFFHLKMTSPTFQIYVSCLLAMRPSLFACDSKYWLQVEHQIWFTEWLITCLFMLYFVENNLSHTAQENMVISVVLTSSVMNTSKIQPLMPQLVPYLNFLSLNKFWNNVNNHSPVSLTQWIFIDSIIVYHRICYNLISQNLNPIDP